MAEDIERIEVIRGPQSGLYGSSAIGGVINIVTKGGKGPFTATVQAEGGGYGMAGVSGRVSGGNDRAWIALSAQHRSGQFFNLAEFGGEEDPWRTTTVNVRGGVTIMTVSRSTSHCGKHNASRTQRLRQEVPPGGVLRRSDGHDPIPLESNLFLGGVNVKWDTFGGALTHVFRADAQHHRPENDYRLRT